MKMLVVDLMDAPDSGILACDASFMLLVTIKIIINIIMKRAERESERKTSLLSCLTTEAFRDELLSDLVLFSSDDAVKHLSFDTENEKKVSCCMKPFRIINTTM